MDHDLRKEYEAFVYPPEDASPACFRKRGFALERIIHSLLQEEKLNPRTSYKIDGEQIDGSFIFDGRFFLLEAKWHKNGLPASEIYQFKGKVDGKLIGTIGIFISMSGFSEDAVNALSLGKDLNVILFDKDDFESCLSEDIGFREVLGTKLRRAAEQGAVYFPFKSVFVDSKGTAFIKTESYSYDAAKDAISGQAEVSQINGDVVIICEGYTDRDIISFLANKILQEYKIEKSLSVVTAMGKFSLPKVAQGVKSLLKPTAKLVLVADSDGNLDKTTDFLRKHLDFQDWVAIIPDPSIEEWFSMDHQDFRRILQKERTKGVSPAAVISEIIKSIDIGELEKKSASFHNFVELLKSL